MPISWPVLGNSGPGPVRSWLGDPTVSDYNSLYAAFVDGQPLYPYGKSLYQTFLTYKRPALDQRPYWNSNAPAILETSGTGWYYRKMVQGDEFQAGQDLIQGYPIRPEEMTASITFAAAAGMSGVRVYGFDSWQRKGDRTEATMGAAGVQTFIDPFVTNVDGWKAVSMAFRLIQAVEPYLLQPNMQSPNLGPMIYTGAKQGTDGKLLMAINFSELPQAVNIDLTPYDSGGGVTRYRTTSQSLTNGALSRGAKTDPILLLPGETVTYVFGRR
jgi:hypothetical protein